MTLHGRKAECQVLDGLIADVLTGKSRVIVLRGEAGIGKSALLAYVSDLARDTHVAMAAGVESEMELAYGALQQLCWPMLDRLDRLSSPQRNALATVFGLRDGPAPDRFLVGLATLTLFAEVAEQQPLVCLVEDAQWLDQASAQILAFVARRLLAERIAIVCAARTTSADQALAGLPELVVSPLSKGDGLALLLDNLQGPFDAAICQRIVAESHGNPLALLELPRTWNNSDLAAGFGLPDGMSTTGKIERSYERRLRGLPVPTQLLVLAAAAEPVGDPVLLRRAAESLEIEMAAVDAATDAGLLTVGRRVRFAHPLVRSAAYRCATSADRHRVHRALAAATDATTDPDRRAWHRARAASGPDEDVARDLERSASRAQARGGVAAAAAFLRQSVALTADASRRAERAIAAAEASLLTGAFDEVLELAEIAQAGTLDGFQQARIDVLRGHLAYASHIGSDAPQRLLKAAQSLEPFDSELARETYLIAWFAAVVVGHVEGEEVMREICRAVQALPRPPGEPPALHLLLDGLVLLTTDGPIAATPVVLRASEEMTKIPAADVRRWGWAGPAASSAVWDDQGLLAAAERNLQIVRDAGAFAELPQHLHSFGTAHMWLGDFARVAAVMAETEIIEAASGRYAGYVWMTLRALEGDEAEASALIQAQIDQAASPGRAGEAAPAHWAAAVLNNGLARYEEAKAAAEKATWNRFNQWFAKWALPEMVEAAVRTGDTALARDALERLAGTTQPAGTDFGLGIEARCRALVADDANAESLFREAVERLGRGQLRPDQARTHLLYGEWLRRRGRRVDAREQLRTAYTMFVSIGMRAFAERARLELLATGENVRKRTQETTGQLTPQEEQIARLARDGLSNAEIAAQLFIGARTVEWHLGKVFAKLGISSRRQLRRALR
jgi:DNA-binding CsgD family transcriptional regulator